MEFMTEGVIIAIASVLGAIVGSLITNRYKREELEAQVQLDADRIEIDATKAVTTAAVTIVDEVQQECAGLRTMLSELHQRLFEVEKENEALRGELAQTKLELARAIADLAKTRLDVDLYKSHLETVMTWVNEYTPALKKAGIEPPEIDDLQFRGVE